MELWIRSQDREDLVKVNALWIMDNQIWMEVPFYDNHKKLGLTVTSNNHRLAVYKTKERALEVLNEIQNILRGKYAMSFDYKGSLNGFKKEDVQLMLEQMAVYEMPLE